MGENLNKTLYMNHLYLALTQHCKSTKKSTEKKKTTNVSTSSPCYRTARRCAWIQKPHPASSFSNSIKDTGHCESTHKVERGLSPSHSLGGLPSHSRPPLATLTQKATWETCITVTEERLLRQDVFPSKVGSRTASVRKSGIPGTPCPTDPSFISHKQSVLHKRYRLKNI